MNESDDARLRALLQRAFQAPEGGQERDLWPEMLRKLDQERTPRPWFDWVLAGVGGLWIAIFPSVVPGLLYHL